MNSFLFELITFLARPQMDGFLFIRTAVCDVAGVGFGVVLEFVKVVVCGAGGEG